MTRAAVSGDELFRKARGVGQYYGFTPFAAAAAEARGAHPKAPDAKRLALPEEAALDATGSVVAHFLAHVRSAHLVAPGARPLFLWHTNLTPGRPAPKRVAIQFHAIGTERMLAEAVVIRALLALARDVFRDEPIVRLNTMGDRETRARYARELALFFKRRAQQLPEECVAASRKDALAAAELAIARECAGSLPAPTEFLSDASRKRFEELLEYLEATETPYELARDLISRGMHWNDTCFEILVGGRRVAWGSRYNELAKLVFGHPAPAIGAVFGADALAGVLARPSTPHLRFVFVHIGEEAKRNSLVLAEEFKRAHLPLTQDIGVESLTEQIRLAEKRDTPYILIMGRKEALEGTVILRDRRTQEDIVLPMENLPERLKAIA